MKTISLTVSNRPQYLKPFLNSLSLCHNLDNYKLVIGLEPMCEESRQICENIDFMDVEIVYNQTVMGVKANPFQLLNYVFAHSDFNVYLEEDIIVSKDAISLCEWYWKSNSWERFVCLNLHNFWSLNPEADPKRLETIPRPSFMAFGWAMDRTHWETTFSQWWNLKNGWDWNVRDKICEYGMDILAPQFSRCNHLGEFGVHARPADMEVFNKRPLYNGKPIDPKDFYVQIP